MVIIGVVEDDLLDSPLKYIAQQCNCLTVSSHGLSKAINERFTNGKFYEKRKRVGRKNLAIEEDRGIPGTIEIQKGKPNIICIMGQWAPGKPSSSYVKNNYPYFDGKPETAKMRLEWFKMAIAEIEKTVKPKDVVGVPYHIGCGLAGGNWTDYEHVLEESTTMFLVYQL